MRNSEFKRLSHRKSKQFILKYLPVFFQLDLFWLDFEQQLSRLVAEGDCSVEVDKENPIGDFSEDAPEPDPACRLHGKFLVDSLETLLVP